MYRNQNILWTSYHDGYLRGETHPNGRTDTQTSVPPVPPSNPLFSLSTPPSARSDLPPLWRIGQKHQREGFVGGRTMNPAPTYYNSPSVRPTAATMMKAKLWTLSGKLIAVKISLNNELNLQGRVAKMSVQGGRLRPDEEGFADCALNHASCTLHAERVQWPLQVRTD